MHTHDVSAWRLKGGKEKVIVYPFLNTRMIEFRDHCSSTLHLLIGRDIVSLSAEVQITSRHVYTRDVRLNFDNNWIDV